MQGRHGAGNVQRVAIVIQQFVVPHGTLKLGADFGISFRVEPLNAAGADLKHAADSNGAVLQLFVDLAIDAARQQSIRAPGEDDHQERECYCLLEREPGTQAA